MDSIEDKMKELKDLIGPYKSKRESEREVAQKKAEEKDQKYNAEMDACFSKIEEFEHELSEIDFEIEDDEPFFRDRRSAHPEMGYRWVLVKKADKNGLFVRKYSGDTGGKMLEEYEPTREYPLHLIKELCNRLPGFIGVINSKIKEYLK